MVTSHFLAPLPLWSVFVLETAWNHGSQIELSLGNVVFIVCNARIQLMLHSQVGFFVGFSFMQICFTNIKMFSEGKA